MHDLERELRALGQRLEYPPTPELSVRLPAPRPAPLRVRRLALVAAAFVLLLAASAAAFPSAREAVLEWIGVEGVEVRVVPEPPAVAPGATLVLGERVTLREAERRTGVRALLPQTLGRPDAAYADDARLTLRWGSLLLSEAPARIQPFEKEVGPGSRSAPVQVGGTPGVYIDGAPHGVRVDGGELRIAGNTLLWSSGGLVLRLEGVRSLAEALRIAESVR